MKKTNVLLTRIALSLLPLAPLQAEEYYVAGGDFMTGATGLLAYLAVAMLPLASLQPEETPEEKQKLPHIWFDGEYLYWWVKNSPSPVALINEGPIDTAQTTVLGGQSLDTGARSGGKFSAGYWFDAKQVFEVDAGYLFLTSGNYSKTVSSSGLIGSPTLTYPYFNVQTSEEDFTGVALPDSFSGSATLKAKNSMQDAEFNGSFKVFNYQDQFNLRILSGFFWWNFHEKMTFTTDSPFVNPPIDIFYTQDTFQSTNNFYGGQIGFQGQYQWKKFSFLCKGQVALGAMDQKLSIEGKFVTNDFNNYGAPETFSAGYAAMPTNEGAHNQTQFSVIPQVNAQIGCQIVKWLNLHIGYTFLYATNVMWASNQIDRNINPSQAPGISIDPSMTVVGEALPKALMKTSGFWTQGINAGLTLQF
jgi:hypothetical protein